MNRPIKQCLFDEIDSKQRQISFDEIAQRAKIEKSKVEFFVMKALSIGLIQGSIDQINEKVNISWVQPRVFSTDQVSSYILFKFFFLDWFIG